MILTSIMIYLCIEESPRFLFFQDLCQEEFELKELINAKKKISEPSSCEKNKELSVELMNENEAEEKLLQKFDHLEDHHLKFGSYDPLKLSESLEKKANELFLNDKQEYKFEKLDSVDQNQLSLSKNEKALSLLKPYQILLLKIISQNKSTYTLTQSTITELEKWGQKIQKDEINSGFGGNSWSPLFHGRYLKTTQVNQYSFLYVFMPLLK